MARDPKAEIEISAHSRGLNAKLREARAKFATFGSELKKNVFGKDLVEKGFWSKAGASMVGNLGADLAGRATDFFVEQARDVFEFEKSLSRLGIATGKSPAFMRQFADSVRRTSEEVGISAAEVLAASRAYVALTGDMDGAAAATMSWARVAQATDSNVQDVAKTAAALRTNLKIDPGDMEKAFAALAVQGKEGAVELKDLAGQLANIAPQWALFQRGLGVEGLKEMGAALQIVKQGFGGEASETVNGLRSLLTALAKNAKNFEKAKIKIFDKDPSTGVKRLRNVLDIVNSIAESKLAKDPTKLQKALGRDEAFRAYIQLSQNKQLLEDLIEKSGDTQVIARDLDRHLASPAGRIERAWEHAKNKIAEAFTPERIDAFAAGVERAAAAFGPIITGMEMVGKFLGGFKKAGQDIRSFITREDEITPMDRAFAMAGDPAAIAKIENLNAARASVLIKAASSPAARRRLGITARSSEELAREFAAAEGPGAVAKRAAAAKFFAETGIKADPFELPGGSSGPITEASVRGTGEALLRNLLDEMRKQTALLAKGTKVEVNGNTVVDAQRKAAKHARNPRG